MTPAQVFTSTEKFQRINGMSSTWFLIWENERLQSFHCLAQLCISLGNFGSNKNRGPAPKLRNDAAKRDSLSSVVSSCRVPARSSGSFSRAYKLHDSDILGKCASTLCLPAGLLCVWSPGPFCENKKIGELFFGAHPHIITCFSGLAHLLVAAPRQCVSRVRGSPERSSLKG